MHDKSVSLRSVCACVLWLVGVIMVGLELFGVSGIGELGVVSALAGATLHVRGFFVQLCYRERNAFAVGREYERCRLSSVD